MNLTIIILSLTIDHREASEHLILESLLPLLLRRYRPEENGYDDRHL
jgi:hypothetical protein